MGFESTAHEADYWLRVHEDARNNCFSNIQLVGQKYRDKTNLVSKTQFSRHCLVFKAGASSSSTNQNAASDH